MEAEKAGPFDKYSKFQDFSTGEDFDHNSSQGYTVTFQQFPLPTELKRLYTIEFNVAKNSLVSTELADFFYSITCKKGIR